MKKYRYILLIFVLALFVNGSCEHQEGQRFIIRNNSDKEIIIMNSFFSITQDTLCLGLDLLTKMKYQDFIYYRMIPPHSNKNFERIRWGESLINRPNDTLYIGVFYRADIDAMSCEEFEQKFPIKKEWKVTLVDMQAADWTLVYTPEE
jgi:hypothetical protein